MKITKSKWSRPLLRFFSPLTNTFQILKFSIQHKYYIAMINDEEQNFVIPGFYCSNSSFDSDTKEIIRVMGEQALKGKLTGRYQLADGTSKSDDDILTNYTFLSQTNDKNKEAEKQRKMKMLMGDFEPVNVNVDVDTQPQIQQEIQPQQSIYRDVSGEISFSPFAPDNFSDNIITAPKRIEHYGSDVLPCTGIITNKDLEDYISKHKDMMFVKRQDYIGVPFNPQIEDFETSVLKKYDVVNNENVISLEIKTPINYEFKNLAKAIGFMNLNTDTISEYIVNQLLTSKDFCNSLKTAVIDSFNSEINHEKMLDSIKQVNDKWSQTIGSISNYFTPVADINIPDFEFVADDSVYKNVKSDTDFPSTIENTDYVKDIVIEDTYQEKPIFTKEQITKIDEIDAYLQSLL